MQQQASQRYKNIDALRGLAAILVLILHVGEYFLRNREIEAKGRGLLDFFVYQDLGRIGITIFFIISGFVISKSFNTKRKELRSFLIKRFFRLYPLFWVSMMLGIAFLSHKDMGLSKILANTTMLPSFFGQDFIIGLYWSLETELIFYGIMAAIYLSGMLGNLRCFLYLTIGAYVILGVLYLLSGQFTLLPHWLATPYHLSLMFIGVSWRYAYDDAQDRNKKSRFTIHLCLISSVPVAILLLSLIRPTELTSDALAYLTGIIVFWLGLRIFKGASSFMVYLGKISYSVYLLHPIVFYQVAQVVTKSGVGKGLHISVYILLCLIMTVGLSTITYYLVEKPFNKLGRNLAFRKTIGINQDGARS